MISNYTPFLSIFQNQTQLGSLGPKNQAIDAFCFASVEVLLCDEPTSGLDSAAASNMVVGHLELQTAECNTALSVQRMHPMFR